MAAIVGGGSNAKQQTAIGSLQFQTSQRGGVVPLVYGTTRVAPNLVSYTDFTATPASSSGKGKGGGAGKGGGQYSYSASVIMGMCQGPIAGIGTAWWNKSTGTLASLPAAIYVGTDGQATDPYWQTTHPEQALGYSGTANIVANNYGLGNSAALPNFSFEVQGIASSTGGNGLDANPAAIVSDFLTNPRYGAGFPAANLDNLSAYAIYCQAVGLLLSPLLDTQQEALQHLSDIVKITNSAVVWSGDILKILPYGDMPVNGNGVTYLPNLTPVYSLSDDDFIAQVSSVGTGGGVAPGGPALRSGAGVVTGGFGDDPVHIIRSTPADANNSVQIECLDRANDYNTAVVEAFDQASIDLFGIRRDTSIKAHAIVDPINVAPIVAQLVLQRQLLFRNTYTFQLGWKYCLLEPMDLVQITDQRLGAAALTVRVTAVEEDDEGTLSITAEDFFGGYSTAVLYPKQASGGYMPNWDSAPGDVNPPVIFEPPSGLLSGDLEIWIALSGEPDWGSAQVWISSDGSSYALAGTVTGSATAGVLTVGLPPHAAPDTVNTLSVDLSESRGLLSSVSVLDAENLATLSWADGELLAYQNAVLTAPHQYDLTRLYRGAYGTPITDHAAGGQFVRLDRAVGRFPYPENLIGQTIYFKFVSLNVVGGGLQDLSAVPAYPYTITGAGQATMTVVTGTFVNGRPGVSAIIQRYVFTQTVTFEAGLPGSQATAAVPATGPTAFDIQKNGASVGTMTFGSGATTAGFAMTTATVFGPGDTLTLVAPAEPDPTLADLAWSLVGIH
jgi:hypothetical protein